ncbi:MAG: chorismate mutase [Planctomycetota bacterium]|jgi:chorismate mutase
MHPQLDLTRSIRPGLDILANEIIIALKKRTRFPRNPEIYAPGLVVSDPAVSLLDYELAAVERLHAELGRYTYASQEPFTDVAEVEPVIARAPPPNPIRVERGTVAPTVRASYRDWIASSCAAGSDPDTYGETVTADVSALLAMIERVNLGKFVAEYKYAENPARFADTAGDREAIITLLVRQDREAQVYDLARRLAEHYDFDPDQAAAIFERMIAATIDVEVEYIRRRLAGD